MFPYLSLCETCAPVAGPNLSQGQNLSKLDSGLQCSYILIIKALVIVVSDKNNLSCFPYVSNVKHVTTGEGQFSTSGV